MAYSTRSELAALLPAQQGGGSSFGPLTDDQVDSLIADIDNEIDMVIASLGHAVPITGPAAALTFLGTLSRWGAAAVISFAIYQEMGGANSRTNGDRWNAKYREALGRLVDQIDGLIGASSPMQPADYWSANPTDAGIDPVLTTAMEW